MDQNRYIERMSPKLERWKSRSELETLPWNKREYAAARVRGIRRPIATKIERCGTRGVILKCGCKGRRTLRWYGCRQHMVCSVCARSRSRRMTRRITEGLQSAIEREPNRRLVLITLTLRHSGDVEQDRLELAEGWRAFYKALHRRGITFPYVGVYEVTPGEDGLGHVHAHVVVLWPWLDWGHMRELWIASCPSSERIRFDGKRRDGKKTQPHGAAKYIGKYVSKGVEDADFSPELRADVLAAFYAQRMVFSSSRFWQPFQPCCPDCKCRRIRATFRWHGIAIAPGPVVDDDEPSDSQLGLGLADPNERAGPRCT